MKKLILTLAIGLMVVTAAHAQTVVIERPGILKDLASAAGAIASFPFVVVEGVIVGTAEAADSLVHGSTQIIVIPPAKPVTGPSACIPAPVMAVPETPVSIVGPRAPAVIPTTTIVTTHGDGTVTTVTRQASAYELGPVILPPVDPTHRVGPSPYANPYVYRHR